MVSPFTTPEAPRIYHILSGHLPVTGTCHLKAVDLDDGNMSGYLMDLPAPFYFLKTKKNKFLPLYIYLITFFYFLAK